MDQKTEVSVFGISNVVVVHTFSEDMIPLLDAWKLSSMRMWNILLAALKITRYGCGDFQMNAYSTTSTKKIRVRWCIILVKKTHILLVF